MDLAEKAVSLLVPQVYAHTASLGKPGVGLYNDMSHSPKCRIMTLDLLRELRARHLPCKRELHKTPDGWHFIIVHALEDLEPSLEDIITDLNPWQRGPSNRTGYLHGIRADVQETLANAGVPLSVFKLRTLETITIAHTTALTPTLAHSELG